MNKQSLLELLDTKVTSTRENRSRIATVVLNDQSLFQILLQITFDADNPVSVKAAWVLEFVLNKKLDWLIPHFDYFTNNLSLIYRDSAVRPTAKICEFLSKSYTSNKPPLIKDKLTTQHINKIIEAAFDRLINEHKVAVKVYSMEALFLFGKEFDWVHNELRLLIQQEISNGSPAYKARGKRTLLKIQKFEKKKIRT